MEFLLALVLLFLVVAGLVTTALVVGTRRAVRAVRGSDAVRRGRELGGYAVLAAGAVRNPLTTDRTSAALAARVTTTSITLHREVAAARRAGAHLGEVPQVLPGLADEGFRLTRALQRATPAGAEPTLVDDARRHLDTVRELTAAVRASAALPAADAGIRDEAARAAADLQAYTWAYRDLIRPPRTS